MAENKNVKRFKCLNFGACPKADSGEIIEIDALETLGGIPECPHCHQHTLEEVVKKPFPTKLVAIIAAVVVVIAIVIVVVMMGGSGKEAVQPQGGGAEVAAVDSDSIKKAQAAAQQAQEDSAKKVREAEEAQNASDGKEKSKADNDGDKQPPRPQPTSYNMGYGRYEGPMSGGKPHGFGGSITVTSRHTIDLKKASGETVEVGPGDKIMNVKMENGRLRQGEIHFADGTRRFISGL